jgi:ubiquitin-like protein Pup
MGQRVQVQKQVVTKSAESAPAEPVDLANEELNEETEELLDEIDDLLEENAQQFVTSYIQAGGE